MIFFGTSTAATLEATDMLAASGIHLDAMRLRAFPFSDAVVEFIANHERTFVVEQNRDGQMRKLLIIEADIDPEKLVSVTHYDGMSITARAVVSHIRNALGGSSGATITPLRRKSVGEKP